MLSDNPPPWQVDGFDEALAYVAQGIYSEVFIGTLDKDVADRLGTGDASSCDVRISTKSIRHIEDGHPDITIGLLAELLPDILRRGLVILMDENQNKAFFGYQHPDGQRRFGAWLKRTHDGRLYCSTVFRMRPRNTKSLFNRGSKIRNHK